MNNLHGWIQTFSGQKVFPLNFNPNSINIEDIAHALSKNCRFNGHVKVDGIYSVAQHSVLVAKVLPPYLKLYGLLHDASEYVISDIASPIKRLPEFEFYRKIEKDIQSKIYNEFDLDPEEPAEVKEADLRMLATEARDLMSPIHPDWKLDFKPYDFNIKEMSPAQAKQEFLDMFKKLVD